MWRQFEETFKEAQNLAFDQVAAHVGGRLIEIWPPIPPSPGQSTQSNEKEDYIFSQEAIQTWSDNNAMTLPLLKHQIERNYTNMYYNATLEYLYLKRDETSFANHTVAFEKLSEALTYRVSLPSYCCELSCTTIW